MKTLTVKQLLTLGEDNYYSKIGSTHVFYDYFSKNDTLVYKYNKHILPILKGLKDIFPNHQEEFETLLKEEVKNVRWYFDTLVFELKEKE